MLYQSLVLAAAIFVPCHVSSFTTTPLRVAPPIQRNELKGKSIMSQKLYDSSIQSQQSIRMMNVNDNDHICVDNVPASIQQVKPLSKKPHIGTVLSLATLAFTTLVFLPMSANAASAAAATTEHLHIGQKVAGYFKSFGLPDLAILAIISAMPVIELRGAVPVGLWMGLPITKVLPACILGNMIPIVPLMFLLRNESLKKLMKPILDRAEKKSSSLGVGSLEKQWASLAAFVGIPLPGTGAWTGAMGAFLLGMPTAVALSSIFTGVVSAGLIMSAITLAGKKGGIAALCVLALVTGVEFVKGSDDES